MKCLLFICGLFVTSACVSQKTFTYDFRHGEGDAFYGRLHYQLSVQQGSSNLPLDSREVKLIPEDANEEIKVTLLVTKVDLAYKKSTFESKSQDREVEVFYVQFEPIPNPTYGQLDYLSVPKIFDPNAMAGATSTKAVIRFICSNSEPVQSSINLSWKVYFSPRGKSQVIDSRDFNVMVPVSIEAPAVLYEQQVLINEAFEQYKKLAQLINSDPKRKNPKIKAVVEEYLQRYGNIKRPEIQELKTVVRQYENRKDGPEDVYARIKKFESQQLISSASSDINNYVENCILGTWTNCPHLEEVRYMQIVHGNSDTTLIKGFLKVYPQSSYGGELYGMLEEARARGSRSSSTRRSSGYNSAAGVGGASASVDMTEDVENLLDSIEIIVEPAGIDVDYSPTQRRINLVKTGDWEDYNYFYELVGDKGRQGKRAIKTGKQEILYIDDFDDLGDHYVFHVYKRKGRGKYELLSEEITFTIEEASFDTKWILYGLIALVLGGLYFLYSRYIKI